MQCIGAVLSTVACPAILYFYILPHKWHDFWKEKLLNKMYVFRLSLQLLSEAFLVIGRIQPDIIINVRRSSCEVPVILVKF
jgi:hypothetical protein